MKTTKKRLKKRHITLIAFSSIIAFFYVYNQNLANRFVNTTPAYEQLLNLPKSTLFEGNLRLPYEVVSPSSTGSPFSYHPVEKEETNLFVGIDMKQLTGRLTELPVHKRIPLDEEMQYQILWNGILVADATLSTHLSPKDKSKTILHAVITSQSVIQTIYPVNDVIISEVESRTGNCIKYDKRENEGSRQKQIVIDVDNIHHQARYRKFKLGLETRNYSYKVPHNIYDPLSVIYKVRSMNMASFPESITLDVLANKRVATAKLNQEPAVSKTTPLGTFDCYVLSLDMNYPGLFEEVPEGSAFAYLDKHSQILVKVEVSLNFGIITMDLIRWKKGTKPQ